MSACNCKRDFDNDRAVCDTVTGRKWVSGACVVWEDNGDLIADLTTANLPRERIFANAEFIAAAREGWPAALERIAELYKAIESLTPGGSEFFRDADRCVEYVKERQEEMHRILTDRARRERELEAQNVVLRQALEKIYEDAVNFSSLMSVADVIPIAVKALEATPSEAAERVQGLVEAAKYVLEKHLDIAKHKHYRPTVGVLMDALKKFEGGGK